MALTVTPTDEMKTLTVGNKIYEVADDEARTDLTNVKADFLQSLIYDTASGAVATFPDGAHELPCKSVVAQIVPKQSGSGDPSPDNVRPISGWNAVKVARAGANVWGGLDFAQAIYNSLVAKVIDTNNKTISFLPSANPSGVDDKDCIFTPGVKFKENTRYTLLLDGTGITDAGSVNIMFAYTDGTTDRELNRYLTIGANQSAPNKSVKAVVYRSYSGQTTLNYEKCGIFEGVLTADQFEPYTGSTYSVNLPQTVYGGQVDVVSGEGKVTYGMVDLGTLTWTNNRIGSVAFEAYSPVNYVKPYTVNLISNALVQKATFSDVAEFSIRMGDTFLAIKVPKTVATSGAQVRQWLIDNAVTICYELATPTDFTVTPQEVPTLYGSNTVYADSGDVSVEYPADTKLYINKVITDAVSALS